MNSGRVKNLPFLSLCNDDNAITKMCMKNFEKRRTGTVRMVPKKENRYIFNSKEDNQRI